MRADAFSKLEALILKVTSYLVIISSVIGIGLSARRSEVVITILFIIILASVLIIKYIYWRKLCRECEVISCPFNPRRSRSEG